MEGFPPIRGPRGRASSKLCPMLTTWWAVCKAVSTIARPGPSSRLHPGPAHSMASSAHSKDSSDS